jgi:DNA-binding NarL/FixJ family response regulator
VLRLLASGLTQGEAASQLHYSHAYVKEVVAAASRNLGANTTLQAVAIAARRGLI